MLREITAVKQDSNDFIKRWFTSEEIDVYIWVKQPQQEQNYSDNATKTLGNATLDSIDNEIERFDLFYKKPNDEIAISWHRNSGFRYFKVMIHTHR